MRRSLACLILVAMPAAMMGQSKTGTAIGLFTLIDPSARFAAMGGAGSTFGDEAMSIYYNPGSLGAMKQSDFQFTYNSWFAGITLNYAFGVVHLGDFGAASLSVTQLGSGDIEVTTVAQPLGTGERYSVNDLEVGAGYGMRVTDRFSAGVIVNYVNERIWHSSTYVFGVSIGTLYELSPGGLRVAASLINFGTRNNYSGTDLFIRYDIDPTRNGDNSAIPAQITTDDYMLPIVFRVGLGYPIAVDQSNVLNIAVDALHPSDNSESMNVGAEWSFRNVLSVRAGYQSLFQTDSELGLTAGAGVATDASGYLLRFDYGWASHNRLGSVQRFTVGVGF